MKHFDVGANKLVFSGNGESFLLQSYLITYSELKPKEFSFYERRKIFKFNSLSRKTHLIFLRQIVSFMKIFITSTLFLTRYDRKLLHFFNVSL